jgi:thioester reductase-like protein
VEAVQGDLSKRSFGLSFAGFQGLAGRATHVFNCAARVNLTEPFQMMRKDNVEAVAHLLEFCCVVRTKALHHVSTMGLLTPDMLSRDGAILEGRPLGDIRALPLYGTGDQANGYPYTKWLAEKLVFRASKLGLPAYVHRPGLIGGHSESGAMAKDVFFHFLSDVVKTRQVPDMEGDKFNITPVDWVAKSIVQIAMAPEGAAPKGNTFHPAAPKNVVTMEMLAAALEEAGYSRLRKVDFSEWRDGIVADPEQFKSWSFCGALNVEGDGIDSMTDATEAAKAMREAVGVEAFDSYDPGELLKKMLQYCVANGLLDAPLDGATDSEGKAVRGLSGDLMLIV